MGDVLGNVVKRAVVNVLGVRKGAPEAPPSPTTPDITSRRMRGADKRRNQGKVRLELPVASPVRGFRYGVTATETKQGATK